MMFKLLLAAGVAAAGLALPAQAQDADGPVYLLASLKVADLEAYMRDYGFPLMPMLLEAGAEVLVATPQVEVLEGDYTSNFSVIVRFPSREAAERWYGSAEYQSLIAVRQELTDQAMSTLVLAPQFQMPAQ